MSYLIYSVVGFFVLLLLAIIIVRVKKRFFSNRAQHYPENEQLYVGNLPYQVNGFHLKEFFAQFGDVQNVRLIKNNRTGRSKGFAFVTFGNVKDAKKALDANGRDFRGRPMVIRMAKPREEH